MIIFAFVGCFKIHKNYTAFMEDKSLESLRTEILSLSKEYFAKNKKDYLYLKYQKYLFQEKF